MNLSRYLEIREAVLSKAKEVEDKKRMSYTAGDANVLRNFASDSDFVGTNQLQNCFTHTMKQVRGIASFVQHPDIEPAESLVSRAADLINYACLMVANAEEMGRDTGLNKRGVMYAEEGIIDPESWEKLLSNPISGTTWLKKNEAEFAKVMGDHYDYTFGKDDV